jgi:hypothetical protein
MQNQGMDEPQTDVFAYAPKGKEGSDGLRTFLATAYEAERWEGARTAFAHLVVIASVPMFLLALQPGLFTGHLRQFCLLAWALCTLCYTVATAQLFVWRRRRERYRG